MRLRRGRKSMDRRCGKVIEAKPTLGQISPSEAAWAPRGQTARRLDDHLAPFDKRAPGSQRNQVCVRINGGKTAGRERQASSTSLRRDRIGVLEENFECKPWRLSANDSEFLF